MLWMLFLFLALDAALMMPAAAGVQWLARWMEAGQWTAKDDAELRFLAGGERRWP